MVKLLYVWSVFLWSCGRGREQGESLDTMTYVPGGVMSVATAIALKDKWPSVCGSGHFVSHVDINAEGRKETKT